MESNSSDTVKSNTDYDFDWESGNLVELNMMFQGHMGGPEAEEKAKEL